jgi:ABC-type spermidine/putrescine transport system permease subunit I
MFEGRLIEDEPDRVRIQSDRTGRRVYVDHGISAAPARSVWVAIRPEKISIRGTQPADMRENCVRGVVKEIAYMGDMSIYLVRIDSGQDDARDAAQHLSATSDDERITWDEDGLPVTGTPAVRCRQQYEAGDATRGRPARLLRQGSLGRCGTLCFRTSARPALDARHAARNWAGGALVIAVPYLWLLLFFLVPFVIVLKISFSKRRSRCRRTHPSAMGGEALRSSVNSIPAITCSCSTDNLYCSAFLYSLQVAAVSTVLCLLIGYPMAYAIARSHPALRNILLMLVILPFWTSFLLRVYAWIGLLKNNGLLNNFLIWLGVIDEPIVMLQTDFATYIGIVYSYLPFMILPLYANLEKHDLTLLEAAADLGLRAAAAFLPASRCPCPARHRRRLACWCSFRPSAST